MSQIVTLVSQYNTVNDSFNYDAMVGNYVFYYL